MQSKKIIITGGVLTPALAVIEGLQQKNNWEIFYLGRKFTLEGDQTSSVESKLIPQAGVKFIAFNPGRLQRRFTRHTIPSLLRIPGGFLQVLLILLRIRPNVICSFGGYVSVPVVLGGWLLRIPIITHEQTVVFGLASKINAFFSRRIAVSFPQSLIYFPKEKTVLTGNPLRKAIFEIKKPRWFRVAESSGYPIIYITGGNTGAQVINEAVREVLPELLKSYLVIHQTGAKDYERVRRSADSLGGGAQKQYYVLPYIDSEDIGWVLQKASLVVSRAGANTVCELAALGKPALLIPIPWTYQNEQTENAKLLVEAGTARLLPEENLKGKTLWGEITLMFADLPRFESKSQEAKKLIQSEATKKIICEIESLVGNK